MTHQNHLIYVAFGGSDYRNEVVWSLLSLYLQHPEPDFNIHVFTDAVTELKAQLPHSVVFHELTADQIQLWKGPQNYPYRVKIKVLQQMLETHTGNFLYLDTDVIVRQSLSPLFASIAQGSVFMDANEGPLHANKGGIARKMKKLLRNQQQFRLPSGEIVHLDTQFEVWNSGCIGLTNRHLPQLQKAEALMDVLYATYPLFSMEQIAVTEALQSSELHETQSYLHHYWYFKEFRPVIRDYLKHYPTWEARLQHLHSWDPWELSVGKRQYKQKGFWGRTYQKIRYGYRWKNPVFLP